jgi:hypothetical protein
MHVDNKNQKWKIYPEALLPGEEIETVSKQPPHTSRLRT